MDYEKKIREYMNSSKLYKDILSILFPELAESEDERIRKELITHCRNTRCVTEEGAERTAKWISWLEKQGEQKPFDYENANIQRKDFAPKEEPKQEWSEEDESILSDIVNHFDGFPLKHQTHEIFGWLVSLKHRIG